MRARYDKSLVKAVGVLLKLLTHPLLFVFDFQSRLPLGKNVISDNLPTESDLTRAGVVQKMVLIFKIH